MTAAMTAIMYTWAWGGTMIQIPSGVAWRLVGPGKVVGLPGPGLTHSRRSRAFSLFEFGSPARFVGIKFVLRPKTNVSVPSTYL